jgi:hypothetical protein
MNRLTFRVAIAVCTFILGVIAATVWLSKPAPKLSLIPPDNSALNIPAPPTPKATPDSTVYSVKFCDLIQDPNRYDGKIVRIQAFYNQGTDTSSLSDSTCDAWLRPSCAGSNESCTKMWDRIIKVLQSSRSYRVRIDVIGRYTADIADPDPNQGGYHVHYLEMLELKGAKATMIRDR